MKHLILVALLAVMTTSCTKTASTQLPAATTEVTIGGERDPEQVIVQVITEPKSAKYVSGYSTTFVMAFVGQDDEGRWFQCFNHTVSGDGMVKKGDHVMTKKFTYIDGWFAIEKVAYSVVFTF